MDDAEVIQSLGLDSFTGRERQIFVARRVAEVIPDAPAELALELMEVTPLGPKPASDMGNSVRQSFTLLFKGPVDPVLPSSMHEMVHAELRSCSLLISPVQLSPRDRHTDDACTYYEAIFG